MSKVTIPGPEEDDIRQALFKVIEALKEPGEAPGGFTEPALLPVEAEWTGYRANATEDSAEPSISEAEKYSEMMKEVSSPTTVLYIHGGAFYLLDPASHRPTCKKLAKLTKGRCLSIRYRLAPQNPFPAALLDVLVAYFSLLYPPAGSLHEPVSPEHIVFSGDSAGGNLCLVLLQTLLELRRQGLKILWNGKERDVPLPAGVALNSPWCDITHSSPSCEANRSYDYLPAVSVQERKADYPPDEIWPVNPPRKHLYADDAMLTHPLANPIVAANWEGSCPVWMVTGTELLTDEDKYVAMKLAKQGITVVFEQFETMPHCFAMVLGAQLAAGRKCFDDCAQFIRDVVERPSSVSSSAKIVKAKTLEEVPADLLTLSPFTGDEEVKARMRERLENLPGKSMDGMSKL